MTENGASEANNRRPAGGGGTPSKKSKQVKSDASKDTKSNATRDLINNLLGTEYEFLASFANVLFGNNNANAFVTKMFVDLSKSMWPDRKKIISKRSSLQKMEATNSTAGDKHYLPNSLREKDNRFRVSDALKDSQQASGYTVKATESLERVKQGKEAYEKILADEALVNLKLEIEALEDELAKKVSGALFDIAVALCHTNRDMYDGDTTISSYTFAYHVCLDLIGDTTLITNDNFYTLTGDTFNLVGGRDEFKKVFTTVVNDSWEDISFTVDDTLLATDGDIPMTQEDGDDTTASTNNQAPLQFVENMKSKVATMFLNSTINFWEHQTTQLNKKQANTDLTIAFGKKKVKKANNDLQQALDANDNAAGEAIIETAVNKSREAATKTALAVCQRQQQANNKQQRKKSGAAASSPSGGRPYNGRGGRSNRSRQQQQQSNQQREQHSTRQTERSSNYQRFNQQSNYYDNNNRNNNNNGNYQSSSNNSRGRFHRGGGHQSRGRGRGGRNSGGRGGRGGRN